MNIYGKYNTAIAYADELSSICVEQLTILCNQKFTEGSRIRIMPDAHAGNGCVIGTTMTIKDKIVPNLVGVDIGCGMMMVPLEKTEPDYDRLDRFIRENIPAGYNIHQEYKPVKDDEWLFDKLHCKDILDMDKALRAIGTLGGGNHFIEVDRDDSGYYYLVIHSGSRNPGLKVAMHYQNTAKKICSEDVPSDLRYLEGDIADDYIDDVLTMTAYAHRNRFVMADAIIKGMRWDVRDGVVDTVHNTIDTLDGPDGWKVLRKGATSARAGEELLIPMNMRDGSLLCRGKGACDWNFSAPHGAGRLFSRAAAKRSLSLEEFQKQMEGIYSTCISQTTLDESPMAYKPMDSILKNMEPTVEVLKVLKPVYNFKADENSFHN